jgi:predicted N-acetyltransferase YhbS
LEKQEDYRETENLVREAFWNVYRPGCSEHYVIHVLRDDPAFVKELDFVMEKNGRLIGQNMFMKNVIEADDGMNQKSDDRFTSCSIREKRIIYYWLIAPLLREYYH